MNTESVESRVVAFFNAVQSPVEIQNVIQDDPNFGQPLRYGINLSTAQRILAQRKRLPDGKFASLRQIDGVPGVGPSTLHNILYTFWLELTGATAPVWQVHIEGIVEGPFLAVEGLENTTEVQETADGNSLLVRKRPGRSGCANLILRRALTAGDELADWYRATVEGQVQRKDGEVVLLGGNGDEIARLRFSEAWPCRWRCDVEDSAEGTAMIEEVELSVESLEYIPS